MSRQYEATLTVRCGNCDTADSASMAATSGQEATAGAMMLLRYRGWRIGKGGKSVMDKDRCPACADPLDPCIGCGQPLPDEYRARRWASPNRHECAACDRRRVRAARAASKAERVTQSTDQEVSDE